jgi:DNA-binding response OmpR family regulator
VTAYILVVEDDINLQETIMTALQDEGYQVQGAMGGQEAIELITQGQENLQPKFSVVLTDIRLQDGFDGIAVLEGVRKYSSTTQVVMMTAYSSTDSAIDAMRLGAHDYLRKPVQLQELQSCIARAVRKHQEELRNEKNRQLVQNLLTEMMAKYGSLLFSTSYARLLSEMQERGNLFNTPNADKSSSPPISPSSDNHQQEQYDQPTAQASQNGTDSAEVCRYHHIGHLTIDTCRHEVFFREKRVQLTPTEYRILYFLAESPGYAASFEDITAYARGHNLERGEARDLLHAHMRNLRNKINMRYIVSIRGFGFKLINPEEEAGSH